MEVEVTEHNRARRERNSGAASVGRKLKVGRNTCTVLGFGTGRGRRIRPA